MNWKRSTSVFVATLLAAVGSPAWAEGDAGHRLRLAREVFEATGGEERLQKSLDAVFGALDMEYERFFMALLQELEFESDHQRTAFAERIEAEKAAFRKSMSTVLSSQYVRIALEVMTPIYAEMYTADELQQLIDFYRSPLGRKLTETQPERMQRAMGTLMDRFVPVFQQEVQQALLEERERLVALTD